MTALDDTTGVGHARIVTDVSGLDRDGWLAARQPGIGGSDAAAICGQNRWATPMSVWLEKTGMRVPDDVDSEAAEWGRRLEPIVRDVTAEKTGLHIEACPWLLAHPEHDWMLANIDGYCWSPEFGHGVYEGKTAGAWVADEWDDDQVPGAYLIQGQHYLAVTGLDYVCYGVLIGGQRHAVRWVRRDDDLIESLVKIEAEFWQRVIDQRPPEPDGSQACTDLLSKLWDPIPEQTVTLDRSDVLNVIAVREMAAEDEKAAKALKDEASNRLRLWLADSEVAVDVDGRPLYTWKESVAEVIDPELVRTLHPDVAAECTKASPRRTLRIPKPIKAAAVAARKE